MVTSRTNNTVHYLISFFHLLTRNYFFLKSEIFCVDWVKNESLYFIYLIVRIYPLLIALNFEVIRREISMREKLYHESNSKFALRVALLLLLHVDPSIKNLINLHKIKHKRLNIQLRIWLIFTKYKCEALFNFEYKKEQFNNIVSLQMLQNLKERRRRRKKREI
jgi:hypothetical protein